MLRLGISLVVGGVLVAASGPVIVGDRSCVQDATGQGSSLQERIVCRDAKTGAPLWEKRLTINHTELPPDRAGSALPAIDAETGHVFVLTIGGELAAFTRSGVPLWSRDLAEEFAFVAVASAPTSPVVSGPLVTVGGLAFDKRSGDSAWVNGERGTVNIVPSEVTLVPGQRVTFHVWVFDANGRFVREEGAAAPVQQSASGPSGTARGATPPPAAAPTPTDLQWSLEGLSGAVQPGGTFTAPTDTKSSSGKIRVNTPAGAAEGRVRIVPRRFETSFDEVSAGMTPGWWLGNRDAFTVSDQNGNRVLTRRAEADPSRVVRLYAGARTSTNYTTQADVRLAGAQADAGVAAQGYELVLSGRRQRLELQSWQPEASRTKGAAMQAAADAWYRVKLRVDLLADGSVQARGKAWRASDAEPADWSVTRTDPPGIGHLIGSPGVYASGAPEAQFDNLKVVPN